MAAAPVLPASSAPTPQPAPLSQGARIIDTFVAPSKTFTDLRRSASWWAPWILIALTALLMAYAMGKQVGFEQISKSQIEHSKRADQFDKLPADQQAAQLRITSKIMAGASYLGPFLLFAILPDHTASLGDVQSMLGAETSFGQAFATVMYGWLPGMLGAILAAIALFAGVNPEGFDINNPVGTNVGYYLDPETVGRFVRSCGVCARCLLDLDGHFDRHRLLLHQQGETLDRDYRRSGLVSWSSSLRPQR